MNHIRHQLSMSNAITSQLISHDLPGFTAMIPQQTLEEALRCRSISFGLEIDIDNFAILINCSS
jgi:hypothetical protein